MHEIEKHFSIPKNISMKEPVVASGFHSFASDGYPYEGSATYDKDVLQNQFTKDIEDVAPDLKSHSLSQKFSASLFHKLESIGVTTLEQAVRAGSHEFYAVGKHILGPLAVSFVDTALKNSSGKTIFPARDATPFFYIAKTLKTLDPSSYHSDIDDIQNPVFNRKLWGIEDEQDPENHVIPVTHPMVQQLLSQMGFFSNQPKSFIEVGCWGSMIDQLHQAMNQNLMPTEEFSVYFLYTHLPESIYGFMNIHGCDVPESILETIADTWEAFPKFFKRPTRLIEENGIVKASLEGKLVASPFLPQWTWAALQGVVDAATDFVTKKQIIDPRDEIHKLWALSEKAQSGEFTGVLPDHTETWSEGETWKKEWKWGKIPPLK